MKTEFIDYQVLKDDIHERVIGKVCIERIKQVQEEGYDFQFDKTNSAITWHCNMVNRLTDALGHSVSCQKVSRREYRRRLVQVAAIAIAAVEASLRNNPEDE
jgi:hypothetical protein